MSNPRKVRLLEAWSDWQPGHVFTEMPLSTAELLIARGVAVYEDEAVRAAPVNRMMSARPMKKPRPSAA